MAVAQATRYCPKCDNELDAQTDGSIITVDIAHNGERIRDAVRKLEANIAEALKGNARYLRLVVGTGVIREETLIHLIMLEKRKTIVGFSEDGSNHGAILVSLK